MTITFAKATRPGLASLAGFRTQAVQSLFWCADWIHPSFSRSVSSESSLLLGVMCSVRSAGLGGSQGTGRHVAWRPGLCWVNLSLTISLPMLLDPQSHKASVFSSVKWEFFLEEWLQASVVHMVDV